LTEPTQSPTATAPGKHVLPGKEIPGLKDTVEKLIEEGQFSSVENILKCADHVAIPGVDEIVYDQAALMLILGDLRMLQQDITNVIMRITLAQFGKDLRPNGKED